MSFKLRKNIYLGVREVAEQLGVSPSTIRYQTETGKLKAVRNPMNRYRLYRQTDVDELLNEIKNIE